MPRIRLESGGYLLLESGGYILTEAERGIIMRYKIAEIEDQIIATLQNDSDVFSETLVDTFAGQISPQIFLNPEYMQGFVKLLPFCLVS